MFVPDPKTDFYVLYGYPLNASLSSLMYNHTFNKLGLNKLYYPLEMQDENGVRDSLCSTGANHVRGGNVTMPHKAFAAKYMDTLAESARQTGVVNTFYITPDGERVGHNTDGIGFANALESRLGVTVAAHRYLILGAGGAATAIAFALAARGAKALHCLCRQDDIHLLRDLEEKMAQYYPGVFTAAVLETKELERGVKENDVVVHATKVGMHPNIDECLLDPELLEARHIVCDVIYNPQETKLLREARGRGCKTMGGLWMLINQGAASFKIWTGMDAPVDYMYEIASAYFTNQ